MALKMTLLDRSSLSLTKAIIGPLIGHKAGRLGLRSHVLFKMEIHAPGQSEFCSMHLGNFIEIIDLFLNEPGT
jgi:hypothetical protein